MIEFNGEQYPTLKAWARAYPAYGEHYAKYVKAGAKTPMDIERMSHAALNAGHKKRDAAPNALKSNITGLASGKRRRG